jgi:4-diphosphocytidyl-2C-methyl-D-erythritol kinase
VNISKHSNAKPNSDISTSNIYGNLHEPALAHTKQKIKSERTHKKQVTHFIESGANKIKKSSFEIMLALNSKKIQNLKSALKYVLGE